MERSSALGKDAQDVLEGIDIRRLVQRDANLIRADMAEIDVLSQSILDDLLSLLSLDNQGIKRSTSIPLDHLISQPLKLSLQLTSEAHYPLSNSLEPLGAMVNSVHSRHISEQRLSSADITRSLLPTNMLLTRLQRQPQCLVPRPILRDTNDTPGDLPLILLRAREERRMWAAEAHGHTKALGVTKGDISAELAGRSQQREGHEVSSDAEHAALLVDLVREATEVSDAALGVGVLPDDADEVIALLLNEGVIVGHDVAGLKGDAEAGGAVLKDGDGLGVAEVGDDEGLDGLLLLAAGQAAEGHGHGFGGGGGLVEDGGVGDGETGEVRGQGLEVEEGVETALADFCLVGSVARVPRRVLKDVPLDDGGHDGAVVATANV
ncbi:hypothetical protein KEM55_005920 [Ascosphaera atra]|nr:hypothetical protein KEM55_005920 [Ascosphaera atra]